MQASNKMMHKKARKKHQKSKSIADPKAIINTDQLFKRIDSDRERKTICFSAMRHRQNRKTNQKQLISKKQSEKNIILCETNMSNHEMQGHQPQKQSQDLQQNKQLKRIVSAQGQNYQSPYKYFQKVRKPSLPLQKCIKSRIKYRTFTSNFQGQGRNINNNSIHINNLHFQNPKIINNGFHNETQLNVSVQLSKNQDFKNNKINNIQGIDIQKSKYKNITRDKDTYKNAKMNVFGEPAQTQNGNCITINSWNKSKEGIVIKQQYNLFEFYINQLKSRRNERASRKKAQNQKPSPITIKSLQNRNVKLNQQSIIRMQELYKRWKNKQKLEVSGKTIKSRKILKKQYNFQMSQSIYKVNRPNSTKKGNKQIIKSSKINNFFAKQEDVQITGWKSEEFKDIIVDEF